ncbi:MFS transporter [Pantoea sp. A4]|uniref:MFS transporter n=1 Tax=Pantoea sp. A4 TaxID=1225184 RepID=UPI0003806140|nr:MFS transporter [Pantoea sp. A4]
MLTIPDHEKAIILHRAVRKASLRMIPLLVLAYIFSYLDRVNIGFAALSMNSALGITPAQFGFGSGIFFITYALCEIPSNLALNKFGARIWLSRIMITWGLISAATAFVTGAHSFYTLRFLLGIAEAGFFPGVAFYLTCWFPPAWRARILALFTLGIPLSSVVGGLISGYLLSLGGAWGLADWQLIFIVEGLPATVIGIVALFVLTDSPDQARWLSEQEKQVMKEALNAPSQQQGVHKFSSAIRDKRVLVLSLALFAISVGITGIGMWLPLMIKEAGLSNLQTGMVSTLPYLCSALVMFSFARMMDRRQSYALSLALFSLVAAAGFVASTFAHQFPWEMVFITVAMVGVNVARTALWSIPPLFLRGAAAAGAIAFINCFANFAGLFGPYSVGVIKQLSGSFSYGLAFLALFLLIAAICGLCLWRMLNPRRPQPQTASQLP